MSGARSAGWLALLAGVCGAAALHALDSSQPSIYDGLPPPEGPYRYVSPPPTLASSNQAPLSGSISVSIQDGQVRGAGAQTDDGQSAIFFESGALRPPVGATSVRITIIPVKDPPEPPPHLAIAGNVYRFSVVGEPGGSPVTLNRPILVTLRTPPPGYRTLQSYDGRRWQKLRIIRVTGHYVTASLPALEQVAATSGPGGAGKRARLSFVDLLHRIPPVIAAAVLGMAVVVAFSVIGIRRRWR